MYVSKMKAIDFKGVKRFEHNFVKNRPVILTGKNGAGKTSIIQAFRYGLTGEAPSSPINSDANDMLVSLELTDETGEKAPFTLDRGIKRPNKGFVSILGKTTTGTSEKKFMEEYFGIDSKEMNLVMSSEVLANTKPAALGELFLKHDKRVVSSDDIKKMFLADKSKARIDLSGSFPEKLPKDLIEMFDSFVTKKDLNLEEISNIADKAKGKRKEMKALYAEYASRSKDFKHIVKPTYDEETLRKKLDEIVAVEKNIEIARELQRAYSEALKAHKNQESRLSSLELQKVALGTIEKPNPADLKAIKDDIKSLEGASIDSRVLIDTIKTTINNLSKTKEKLSTSICPLSKHLVCHTDKSGLLKEIEATISENEKAIITAEKQYRETFAKLEQRKKDKEKYEKNKAAYDKLSVLEEAIKNIQDNPIKVPEKPTVPIKSSYESEKREIKDALKAIQVFNDCETDYKKSLIYKRLVDLSDYIYKACDNGGIVKEAFIKASVEMLEEICNERAFVYDPSMHISFVIKDGLNVLFNLNGTNLPYENLSKGEKITAIMMIMDLLNSYLGSKILVLDELNDLDERNFEKLLNFILDPDINCDYLNIVLSCVNHTGLMKIMDKYRKDLDIIEM